MICGKRGKNLSQPINSMFTASTIRINVNIVGALYQQHTFKLKILGIIGGCTLFTTHDKTHALSLDTKIASYHVTIWAPWLIKATFKKHLCLLHWMTFLSNLHCFSQTNNLSFGASHALSIYTKTPPNF